MRFLFLLLFFHLHLSFVSGQNAELRAYINTKQFYAPPSGNYIEIYFQFVGHSLNYRTLDTVIQAKIAVELNIRANQSVIKRDAYVLESPPIKDSMMNDFFDLRRYLLPPGKYTLAIKFTDLHSSDSAVTSTQEISLTDMGQEITFSDIQPIEYGMKGFESSPFHKSGYYLLPRLSNYYPEQLSTMPVYLELYHSTLTKDSLCGIKQSIINTENGAELTEHTVYNKIRTAEVVPILRKIDISSIPSGKYALCFTLISRSMNEICKKSFLFERTNEQEMPWNLESIILDPSFQSSINEDSTAYYLESLIPISHPAEVKNILSTLKKRNSNAERKHIQAFWIKASPTNSYDAWIRYKLQVQLVERLYSNNFQEGFETDRGRVYLQYGAPSNLISRETSPSEYPYEIWQYNTIGKFNNKRFIFYNPDLVNNAHRLLHSDMIGELKNPSWPYMLSKRNTVNGPIDDPNANTIEHWGGNSNDLFRQY